MGWGDGGASSLKAKFFCFFLFTKRSACYLTIFASPAIAASPSFTAAQAATGHTQYGQACAACHGADLRGITGPALIGQAFAKPADHYTLALIFNTIWQGTPAGAPDSLSRSEYLNITAYILSRNGFAPGPTPLTYATATTSRAPIASQLP